MSSIVSLSEDLVDLVDRVKGFMPEAEGIALGKDQQVQRSQTNSDR